MSFYVHGDDGYKWLTCNDCEEPLMEIDAGTWLDEMIAKADAHVCTEKAPTPAA